jgi:preprotein translocase subunit SecA
MSSARTQGLAGFYTESWISQELQRAFCNTYEKGMLQNLQTSTLLEIIDVEWTDHIERMSYLRETINWKSYGQQNPLIEYNVEAKKSFKQMFRQIRESMLNYFLITQIME